MEGWPRWDRKIWWLLLLFGHIPLALVSGHTTFQRNVVGLGLRVVFNPLLLPSLLPATPFEGPPWERGPSKQTHSDSTDTHCLTLTLSDQTRSLSNPYPIEPNASDCLFFQEVCQRLVSLSTTLHALQVCDYNTWLHYLPLNLLHHPPTRPPTYPPSLLPTYPPAHLPAFLPSYLSPYPPGSLPTNHHSKLQFQAVLAICFL